MWSKWPNQRDTSRASGLWLKGKEAIRCPQQILKPLKLVKTGETRFGGALNGNEGESLTSSG